MNTQPSVKVDERTTAVATISKSIRGVRPLIDDRLLSRLAQNFADQLASGVLDETLNEITRADSGDEPRRRIGGVHIGEGTVRIAQVPFEGQRREDLDGLTQFPL